MSGKPLTTMDGLQISDELFECLASQILTLDGVRATLKVAD